MEHPPGDTGCGDEVRAYDSLFRSFEATCRNAPPVDPPGDADCGDEERAYDSLFR